MRITRGKTGSRRSQHKLKEPRLSHDKDTDSTHLRHHVDLTTGMYRGKQVFTPKVKTPKVKEEVEKVEKVGRVEVTDEEKGKVFEKIEEKEVKKVEEKVEEIKDAEVVEEKKVEEVKDAEVTEEKK